jgi:hypothetical protein
MNRCWHHGLAQTEGRYEILRSQVEAMLTTATTSAGSPYNAASASASSICSSVLSNDLACSLPLPTFSQLARHTRREAAAASAMALDAHPAAATHVHTSGVAAPLLSSTQIAVAQQMLAIAVQCEVCHVE